MLIRKQEARTFPIPNCHGGVGVLLCREVLRERSGAPGFALIHDDVLEPGASIGEHTHRHDDEIYVILEGHGTMRIDGQEVPVGPGDVCVTRIGHSHALQNSADGPMRLLVVGVVPGEGKHSGK